MCNETKGGEFISCCPEPQVVTSSMCNTFDTDVLAADALQIFEQAEGSASGYVTITNFTGSGGPVSLSSTADGTVILAGDIDPGNSFTVFVPNLTELYVFSTDGETVIGQVSINIFQTVRP
ncbi:S-Ena type endospore appendage [Evansella halocellulosilytica]|uniref:S-Ena type endospore appendage n=1 Tax=Evansella halocellulosilytica TaxID=2011013 RepID=UPI0027BA666B|nr:S-Ena type endospore appendage [Evansella halocellulosilytica]